MKDFGVAAESFLWVGCGPLVTPYGGNLGDPCIR